VSGVGAYALTRGEERIVRLVMTGRTNPEVAEQLGLSRQTVEWHLWRAYRKLGVHSRAELAGRLAPRPPLGPNGAVPLGGDGSKDERSDPLPKPPSAGTYGFQHGMGRKQ
jgi:DNA-binding CsgD family transcriptional regulator